MAGLERWPRGETSAEFQELLTAFFDHGARGVVQKSLELRSLRLGLLCEEDFTSIIFGSRMALGTQSMPFTLLLVHVLDAPFGT